MLVISGVAQVHTVTVAVANVNSNLVVAGSRFNGHFCLTVQSEHCVVADLRRFDATRRGIAREARTVRIGCRLLGIEIEIEGLLSGDEF
jgi:hypothetical protein